jgi:hypothetical protein
VVPNADVAVAVAGAGEPKPEKALEVAGAPKPVLCVAENGWAVGDPKPEKADVGAAGAPNEAPPNPPKPEEAPAAAGAPKPEEGCEPKPVEGWPKALVG